MVQQHKLRLRPLRSQQAQQERRRVGPRPDHDVAWQEAGQGEEPAWVRSGGSMRGA